MNQPRRLALLAALAPAVFAFQGCETDAHYVDPKGSDNIVSLGQINIQDWQMMADKLIASLVSSGALARLPQPPIIAIDRIKNDTQQQVDTSLLEKKIRVALSEKGVQFTNAEGYGEQANYANQRRTDDANVEAFEKGANQVNSTQKMATITLGGKLIEVRARAGETRETSYVFQLSLNDISSGLTLWESEQTISKKGTRPSIGL
jgi:uncharacterized protein (TIGR02722 family)